MAAALEPLEGQPFAGPRVKEEPGDPEPLGEHVEVPPGAVLDKLGSLLRFGRALLRYSQPSGEGWGINGMSGGRWSSFRAGPRGVCLFEDELTFITEGASEWAESELEQLEWLAQEALLLPSTQVPQPSARRPKECRRAVFAFHKAEHAKKRHVKAKAKAEAKAEAKAKAQELKGSAQVAQPLPAVAKPQAAEEPPRGAASFLLPLEADVSVPLRPIIYFMRGPPGCGKSTAARCLLAQHLAAQGVQWQPGPSAAFLPICRAFILSTDDYFTEFEETGTAAYRFNPQLLQDHHQRNRLRAEVAMQLGLTPLFIDNTNIALWEMREYVKLADQFGYTARIIDPRSLSEQAFDPDALFERCRRGTADRAAGKAISRDVFKRMVQRFEELPGGDGGDGGDWAAGLEAIRVAKAPYESRSPRPASGGPARGSHRPAGRESWSAPAKARVAKAVATAATAKTLTAGTEPAAGAVTAIAAPKGVAALPAGKPAFPTMVKALVAEKVPTAKFALPGPVAQMKGPPFVSNGALTLSTKAPVVAKVAAPGRTPMAKKSSVAKVPTRAFRSVGAKPWEAKFGSELAATRLVKAASKTAVAPADASTPAQSVTKVADIRAFLRAVKAHCLTVGQDTRYRRLLAAIMGGASQQEVVQMLVDNADLVAQYKRICAPDAEASLARPKSSTRLESQEPPPAPPLAFAPTASVVDMQQALLPLSACSEGLAAQLVQLVLQKMGARAELRLGMLRYVKSHSTEEGSFREVLLMRGPPGTGKSTWAMEQLRRQVDLGQGEARAARLTHICSADDFFVTLAADGSEAYGFDLQRAELAHAWNEARVQLAMRLGISPLYIDNAHTHLWEMAGYVRLAQQAGYAVSVVSPQDICSSWASADVLAARSSSRSPSRAVPREQLEALLGAFEALPAGEDPLALILAAQRMGRRAVAVPGSASAGAQRPPKRPAPTSVPSGDPAVQRASKMAFKEAQALGLARKPPLHPAPVAETTMAEEEDAT